MNNSFSNLSRRSFITKSGFALSAAALGSPLPTDSIYASSDKRRGKLGIALVGLGGYATQMLMPGFAHTKRCRLTGLVTGTPEKKVRYGKKYDIPDTHIYDYETFDRIADNPDIDIVYVVLPNSMHAEYTIRAAKAGKHVICEKPMCLNVEEAEAMISACSENNVTLNIGYRCQYEPHNLEVIRLARKKPFGGARYVQSELGFIIGDPSQWRLRREYGGGALLDVGVYCMQAACYAIGEGPIAVYGQEFKTDPLKFGEVDETVAFQMEFPSGAISNSTTSFNLDAHRLYVNYQDADKRVEIQPNFNYGKYRGSIAGKPMELPFINQQANHMDVVAQSIMEGSETTTTGDVGLRDMKIIEAIFQSIAKGGVRVEIG